MRLIGDVSTSWPAKEPWYASAWIGRDFQYTVAMIMAMLPMMRSAFDFFGWGCPDEWVCRVWVEYRMLVCLTSGFRADLGASVHSCCEGCINVDACERRVHCVYGLAIVRKAVNSPKRRRRGTFISNGRYRLPLSSLLVKVQSCCDHSSNSRNRDRDGTKMARIESAECSTAVMETLRSALSSGGATM